MDKQQNDERRQEFAPHEDPKKQPDGDPGPKSAPEEPIEEGGTNSPKPVQDQGAND
jgi:hypothetical protein